MKTTVHVLGPPPAPAHLYDPESGDVELYHRPSLGPGILRHDLPIFMIAYWGLWHRLAVRPAGQICGASGRSGCRNGSAITAGTNRPAGRMPGCVVRVRRRLGAYRSCGCLRQHLVGCLANQTLRSRRIQESIERNSFRVTGGSVEPSASWRAAIKRASIQMLYNANGSIHSSMRTE